ncbi:competence protein ComK [Sporosarcina sp. Sa2YVA2]|uniref:Competence protein ComK n=1 Tax=Sporosarcina quadrami TaxID=2762234 RepID=A0ABR8U9U2_9BACL|nr:competence protein ComK [Sporosarcina quadrami]MBD7984570.1 competence protein ComK [Sporosarcina quadrami]
MKLKEYRLDEDALALIPEYRDGRQFTKVLCRNGTVLVEGTPENILNATLLYYGTSLRGARDGTKSILGDIKRIPILMNETLGLYWFPITSPAKPGCIWLALNNIISYEEIDETHTKVWMNGGSFIIVPISKSLLASRIQRAYNLRFEIEGRTTRAREQVREQSIKYEVSKQGGQLNYTFRQVEAMENMVY